MRRILPALTIVAALFVLVPAANAASNQQILTAPLPPATDSLGDGHDLTTFFTYTVANTAAGEDNCAYYSTQFRAVGATDEAGAAWRDVYMYHGLSPLVRLYGAWGANYGTKTVQFRISPTCNPASNVVTRNIEYLKPHTLDPKIEKVTVPTTVTGDTISAAIVAKPRPYGGEVAHLSVRFATENGNWIANELGGWNSQPYKPIMTAPVSAGLGAKGLFVVVDDGTRDSAVTYVRFTRTKAAPPTAPSNNAPTLTAIATPAKVVGSTVSVTVKASDDNAVKRVRFATEAGTWGAWQAWNLKSNVYGAPVSSGLGYKGVFVQVQDAGYATSTILYRKFTRVAAL